MTLVKERAIEMIQRMPEDDMLYVINILQNLEAMSIDKEKDRQRAKLALMDTTPQRPTTQQLVSP